VKPKHRSGFVSILGRPNAGKSTLLNAIVGSKVAIVSSKPQTTRTSVQAVWTQPGSQVVFLDTPGIHEAKLLLHKKMMDAVRDALNERDLLLWVADASADSAAGDLKALEVIRGRTTPLILVLNKVDQVRHKARLLPLIEQYRQAADFAEVIPLSALTGEGLSDLTGAILRMIPEGPNYFPEDHLTDQPERFLAAELIREAVLDLTRQEVPHAVAVLVDKWEEKGRVTRILATVYVEREGQKRIIIGAGGAMLKEIGTRARKQIGALLGGNPYLELFVKVQPDWRANAAFLNELDWRMMTGGGTQ